MDRAVEALSVQKIGCRRDDVQRRIDAMAQADIDDIGRRERALRGQPLGGAREGDDAEPGRDPRGEADSLSRRISWSAARSSAVSVSSFNI